MKRAGQVRPPIGSARMVINWMDESGNQLAGRELRLTGKDNYDDQLAGEESRSSGWVSVTTV